MENLNDSASTEKAKRRGRIKNDIIIKYYQLKMLMFLPFDDAGVLLSKLIIDDDDKGLRYENLSEEEIALMKEFEAEVNRNYQKRARNNPALRVAKMSIAGQAANSKKAFNQYKNNTSSEGTGGEGGTDDDRPDFYCDDFSISGKCFQLNDTPAVREALEKYNTTTDEVEKHINDAMKNFLCEWDKGYYDNVDNIIEIYS